MAVWQSAMDANEIINWKWWGILRQTPWAHVLLLLFFGLFYLLKNGWASWVQRNSLLGMLYSSCNVGDSLPCGSCLPFQPSFSFSKIVSLFSYLCFAFCSCLFMHLFVSCVALTGSLFLKCHQEFMLLSVHFYFSTVVISISVLFTWNTKATWFLLI